mmetsp:Transcript_43092/g.69071  ORF Transcript_43092/g.69071 Transcript_43092/m.69071 type:complete len:80 (-) Transcript_43092:207-446(-)
MNYNGSGAIDKAQFIEPAVRMPYPMGYERVIQQHDSRAVHDICFVFHSLEDSSTDDGGAGGCKYCVEKNVIVLADVDAD